MLFCWYSMLFGRGKCLNQANFVRTNTEIREKLVKYIKVRHVHNSHINLIQLGPGSVLESVSLVELLLFCCSLPFG